MSKEPVQSDKVVVDISNDLDDEDEDYDNFYYLDEQEDCNLIPEVDDAVSETEEEEQEEPTELSEQSERFISVVKSWRVSNLCHIVYFVVITVLLSAGLVFTWCTVPRECYHGNKLHTWAFYQVVYQFFVVLLLVQFQFHINRAINTLEDVSSSARVHYFYFLTRLFLIPMVVWWAMGIYYTFNSVQPCEDEMKILRYIVIACLLTFTVASSFIIMFTCVCCVITLGLIYLILRAILSSLSDIELSLNPFEISLGNPYSSPAASALMISELPVKHFIPGEAEDTGDNLSCAVCLCDYEENDPLRYLPCNHRFHKDCIDEWLKRCKACPFCKQEIDQVGKEPEQTQVSSHLESEHTENHLLINPVRDLESALGALSNEVDDGIDNNRL